MSRFLDLMCSAFFPPFFNCKNIFSSFVLDFHYFTYFFFPSEINIVFLLIFEANNLSYFHNVIYPMSNREKKIYSFFDACLDEICSWRTFPLSFSVHHPSQCDSVPLLSLQDITYATSFHSWWLMVFMTSCFLLVPYFFLGVVIQFCLKHLSLP